MDEIVKAAYLAGVIDGDGSIYMVSPPRMNRRWLIIIQVGNCERSLIEWLHKEWGGFVLFDINKGSNKRPMHYWRVTGNAARRVINVTISFLIIKRKKAVWAREVLKMQKERRQTGKKYTEESRAKFLKIYSRFVNDRKRTIAARKP